MHASIDIFVSWQSCASRIWANWKRVWRQRWGVEHCLDATNAPRLGSHDSFPLSDSCCTPRFGWSVEFGTNVFASLQRGSASVQSAPINAIPCCRYEKINWKKNVQWTWPAFLNTFLQIISLQEIYGKLWKYRRNKWWMMPKQIWRVAHAHHSPPYPQPRHLQASFDSNVWRNFVAASVYQFNAVEIYDESIRKCEHLRKMPTRSIICRYPSLNPTFVWVKTCLPLCILTCVLWCTLCERIPNSGAKLNWM